MEPMTLLAIGGAIYAFREFNRKDYGVLTAARDEHYRNLMEHCYEPGELIKAAKTFYDYGLKSQAAMLKRRADWRGRSAELKAQHEEIFQKALNSANIPAILEVAAGFEGWTATNKASTLREHVRKLQESSVQEVAKQAAQSVETSPIETNIVAQAAQRAAQSVNPIAVQMAQQAAQPSPVVLEPTIIHPPKEAKEAKESKPNRQRQNGAAKTPEPTTDTIETTGDTQT